MTRKPRRAEVTAARREAYYLAALAGQSTPAGRLGVACSWLRAALSRQPETVINEVVADLVTRARQIGATS